MGKAPKKPELQKEPLDLSKLSAHDYESIAKELNKTRRRHGDVQSAISSACIILLDRGVSMTTRDAFLRVARNWMKDGYVKDRNRRELLENKQGRITPPQPPPAPDEVLTGRQLKERLRQEIEKTGSSLASLGLLLLEEGPLPTEELSRRLGKSPKSVLVTLHRLREHLKDWISRRAL